MRSDSAGEQPACLKMSVTAVWRWSAVMVSVGDFMRSVFVESSNVAAVPGGRDPYFIETNVRRQRGDIADQIADIFRLQHAGAVRGAHRHRALIEDRCRDFPGAH